MRPEAVIFDMDDVLCRYDLGRGCARLSRITGQTPRDIRAAIWDSGFEDAADTGGYSDPDAYLAEFGSADRLSHRRGREWVEARRERHAALARHAGARAQDRHARRASPSIPTTGRSPRRPLPELFPGGGRDLPEHYYSFEFGTKKPDPESFTRLMAHMGWSPQRCWFIDDKRSNVDGRHAWQGLAGHHFRSLRPVPARKRGLGFDA